ncbi:MAG: hypothetical protein QOJ29_623 [Thermoleophilaceae bacterium]|jgi:hypothetical protein|nr:hypothetical protein [Thermoleophilaceae bacterium]
MSRGEWIAGASGALMIAALFLPWYSAGGDSVNAWQSMAVDDVILLVSALLAIAAAFVVSLKRLSGSSVAATSLAILPAGVVLILTIYRLLSPAPPVDVSLEIGAWLALLASVGIAVGAWTGATDEGPARRTQKGIERGTAQGIAASELLSLPASAPQRGSEPAKT